MVFNNPLFRLGSPVLPVGLFIISVCVAVIIFHRNTLDTPTLLILACVAGVALSFILLLEKRLGGPRSYYIYRMHTIPTYWHLTDVTLQRLDDETEAGLKEAPNRGFLRKMRLPKLPALSLPSVPKLPKLSRRSRTSPDSDLDDDYEELDENSRDDAEDSEDEEVIGEEQLQTRGSLPPAQLQSVQKQPVQQLSTTPEPRAAAAAATAATTAAATGTTRATAQPTELTELSKSTSAPEPSQSERSQAVSVPDEEEQAQKEAERKAEERRLEQERQAEQARKEKEAKAAEAERLKVEKAERTRKAKEDREAAQRKAEEATKQEQAKEETRQKIEQAKVKEAVAKSVDKKALETNKQLAMAELQPKEPSKPVQTVKKTGDVTKLVKAEEKAFQRMTKPQSRVLPKLRFSIDIIPQHLRPYFHYQRVRLTKDQQVVLKDRVVKIEMEDGGVDPITVTNGVPDGTFLDKQRQVSLGQLDASAGSQNHESLINYGSQLAGAPEVLTVSGTDVDKFKQGSRFESQAEGGLMGTVLQPHKAVIAGRIKNLMTKESLQEALDSLTGNYDYTEITSQFKKGTIKKDEVPDVLNDKLNPKLLASLRNFSVALINMARGDKQDVEPFGAQVMQAEAALSSNEKKTATKLGISETDYAVRKVIRKTLREIRSAESNSSDPPKRKTMMYDQNQGSQEDMARQTWNRFLHTALKRQNAGDFGLAPLKSAAKGRITKDRLIKEWLSMHAHEILKDIALTATENYVEKVPSQKKPPTAEATLELNQDVEFLARDYKQVPPKFNANLALEAAINAQVSAAAQIAANIRASINTKTKVATSVKVKPLVKTRTALNPSFKPKPQVKAKVQQKLNVAGGGRGDKKNNGAYRAIQDVVNGELADEFEDGASSSSTKASSTPYPGPSEPAKKPKKMVMVNGQEEEQVEGEGGEMRVITEEYEEEQPDRIVMKEADRDAADIEREFQEKLRSGPTKAHLKKVNWGSGSSKVAPSGNVTAQDIAEAERMSPDELAKFTGKSLDDLVEEYKKDGKFMEADVETMKEVAFYDSQCKRYFGMAEDAFKKL